MLRNPKLFARLSLANGGRFARSAALLLLVVVGVLARESAARADAGPALCTAATFNDGDGYCLTPNADGSPLPAPQAVKNGDVVTLPLPAFPSYPTCTFASNQPVPCVDDSASDRYQVYDVRTGTAEKDPKSNAAFYETMASSATLPYSFTVFYNDEPQDPTQVALIQNTVVITDSYATAFFAPGSQPSPGAANCTTDAQGFHCDLYLGSRTFKLTSAGAASTNAVSIVQGTAGKASIPRSTGDEMVDITPPVATKYGRTWLPFRVMASDGTNPTPGVSIALSVGAGGAGITMTVGDPTGSISSLITGTDGYTSVAYLIVDESASNPVGSASVSAVFNGQTAKTTWNVTDNLQSVIDSYKQTIPKGRIDPNLQAAFTPPLGTTSYLPLKWYDLNAQNANGAIVCSHYRSLVLDFLNQLRSSPQGWLLNGLDYGPATTQGEGHYFVVLWPHSSSFQGSDALVLDPWPAQTPIVYTRTDYGYFAPRGYKNDPGFDPCSGKSPQPPYPNYANPAPYPMNGAGCMLTEGTVKLVITLHSPVDALFTTPDGKRAGYLSADASINELGDDYQRLDFPENATGTRGKLMEFGETSGTLDVVGLDTGTFGMDVAYVQDGGTVSVARFSDVSVAQGETIHFALNAANPCVAGARADGGVVDVSMPCPASLAEADAGAADSAAGGGDSGGCSQAPGGGLGSSDAWIGLALAAFGAVGVRRARSRRSCA